jgi:hypothetical protein
MTRLLGVMLTFACVFVLWSEASAAFSRNNLGNGTSFGVGAHTPQGDLDKTYLQKYPTVVAGEERATFWLDVCCDTCPAGCPNDCCVEFSGTYQFKDANGVAGPIRSIPTDSSCGPPCKKCKEIVVVESIRAGFSNYPGAWAAPSSSGTVHVNAKCRCCSGPVNPVAHDVEELEPIPWNGK